MFEHLTLCGCELRNGNEELDQAVQFLHDYGLYSFLSLVQMNHVLSILSFHLFRWITCYRYSHFVGSDESRVIDTLILLAQMNHVLSILSFHWFRWITVFDTSLSLVQMNYVFDTLILLAQINHVSSLFQLMIVVKYDILPKVRGW